MKKQILLIVIAILVGILVTAAMKPSAFRIVREQTIDASPKIVFNHTNSMAKYYQWNPWAKLDPNASGSLEGAAEGVGSSAVWDGDAHVGKGRITIVESIPYSLVRMNVEYENPRVSHVCEFSIRAEGQQTHVTWTLTGTNVFKARLVGLAIDQEKKIGALLEKGLRQLKILAERDSRIEKDT